MPPNKSSTVCSTTSITPPPYTATTPSSTFSSPSPTNPASFRCIWKCREWPSTSSNPSSEQRSRFDEAE
ncbi:hypothetical protein U1Q18_043352 [Sarracenia purpurea var. burkii]